MSFDFTTNIKVNFIVAVVSFSFLTSQKCIGQISYYGMPASFSTFKIHEEDVPFVEMEPVVNEELQMRNRQSSPTRKPFLFAKKFDVNITPENSGIWDEAIDGTKIWRVGIRSKGAFSLNLIFDRYKLPDRAQLFIYSPDRENLLGAFNCNNENSSGVFAVRPVPGDELIVEYNEPDDVAYKGAVRISKVNHDYMNLFSYKADTSDDCNVGVYCIEDENIEKQKQSVVKLIIEGRKSCSGTMINNSNNSKDPYLLTAAHCVENEAEAAETVVFFNYEGFSCVNSGKEYVIPIEQTISGSTVTALSESLDFTLLKLNNNPPPEYHPLYSGWNRTESPAPSSAASIHHPAGDVKKIALTNTPLTISSYGPVFTSHAFWRVSRWDKGVTEKGSSGGPLFNNKGELIGTLTGGAADCTTPENDFFSMFSKQWDYYDTSDSHLKSWLDPGGKNVSSIPSLTPYDDSEECELLTNFIYNREYTIENVPAEAGKGYLTGKNSLMPNAFAERFSDISEAVIHAVSLAYSRPQTGLLGEEFVIKLYGIDEDGKLPDNELASYQVKASSLDRNGVLYAEFDTPVKVTSDFFIGYEIDDAQQYEVAAYHVPIKDNILNSTYINVGGTWSQLPDVTEGHNTSTSLLIKAHVCGALLENWGSSSEKERQFEIYSPDMFSNQICIKNTGESTDAEVSVFNLTGQKMYESNLYLVSYEPKCIHIASGRNSGVYFVAVKTEDTREVMKVIVFGRK